MELDVKSGSRAATKPAAPSQERFVEVVLVKKYVPHHCYELEDGIAMLVRNTDGTPAMQKDVVVGEAQDKFGRAVVVKREILQAIPPGTRIEIPRDEAMKLINLGKAQISARSFE